MTIVPMFFSKKGSLSVGALFESYLCRNNRQNYKQTNTTNMKRLDPKN